MSQQVSFSTRLNPDKWYSPARGWSRRIGGFSIGWKRLDLDANVTEMHNDPRGFVRAHTEKSTWRVYGWKFTNFLFARRAATETHAP